MSLADVIEAFHFPDLLETSSKLPFLIINSVEMHHYRSSTKCVQVTSIHILTEICNTCWLFHGGD